MGMKTNALSPLMNGMKTHGNKSIFTMSSTMTWIWCAFIQTLKSMILAMLTSEQMRHLGSLRQEVCGSMQNVVACPSMKPSHGIATTVNGMSAEMTSNMTWMKCTATTIGMITITGEVMMT